MPVRIFETNPYRFTLRQKGSSKGRNRRSMTISRNAMVSFAPMVYKIPLYRRQKVSMQIKRELVRSDIMTVEKEYLNMILAEVYSFLS